MSFELGRIERILRDYAVTAIVDGEEVALDEVGVALLPANVTPSSTTVWETKAIGTVPNPDDPEGPDVPGITILWTGAEAPTHDDSVLVPLGSHDAYLKVNDVTEIDHALIERIDCV